MIERSFDAGFINYVINHSSVYPWVASIIPKGELDLGPLLLDERNILFINKGGGLFFKFMNDGIYESHIQFLPEFRGRFALKSAKEAVRHMFKTYNAEKLIGKIPIGHLGSTWIVRLLNGKQTGNVHLNAVPSPCGYVDGIEYQITRELFEESNYGN